MFLTPVTKMIAVGVAGIAAGVAATKVSDRYVPVWRSRWHHHQEAKKRKSAAKSEGPIIDLAPDHQAT